jgi:hypothetical protein
LLKLRAGDGRPGETLLRRSPSKAGASPNAPSKPKQARHYTENLTGPADALNRLPETAWTPAYDGDGEPREGADVAELTGLLNLTGWPARTHVIARREVPHPGAQLRPVECNGRRITCFATNTSGGQLPDLKLRHRRRDRAEDRIRCAKDRPGQPAASRRGIQRGLAGHRSPPLRPAHLDPDAVIGAAAGGRTQDAAPAAARHRRAPDLIRAANPATAGPALALGRHRRRRSDAARLPRPRLITPPLPRRPEDRRPGTTPGATAGNNHTPNTITGERR